MTAHDQAAARSCGAAGAASALALEPVARGALRLPDLAVRHFGGDLAPHARRLRMAPHGREIEPLVRRYEIGRNRAAGRVHHAELVEGFSARIDRSKRRAVDVGEIVTGHDGSPLYPLRASFSPRGCTSQPASS